jgi:hypothetical protein
MSSLPTPSADTLENSTRSPSWKIKLLYDGECPLCLREVNFLQKRDAGRGLVAFVDIAAENYNPEENGGISFAAAMGRIHAVLADGTIIQNVEVFRQVYDALYDIMKPHSIPQAVLIIADYQYKQAFVADAEINTVACLTELMVSVEFK